MKITKEQYEYLLNWIHNNFIRSETYNHRIDSGGLRATFTQGGTGFYVDGDTFKQAMLDCGYEPRSYKSDYWEFKVSPKSPAILRYYGISDGRSGRRGSLF